MTDQTFAERLKSARREVHLTQRAIKDLIGIPERTIQDWENGRATPPKWCQELVIQKLKSL